MRYAFLLLVLTLGVACDKPTDDQCRKAVENIRRLTGTANSEFGADPEAAVRTCKGNASKQSVVCMMEAKTVEELEACEGDAADEFIADEEAAEKKRRDEWEKKQKESGE